MAAAQMEGEQTHKPGVNSELVSKPVWPLCKHSGNGSTEPCPGHNVNTGQQAVPLNLHKVCTRKYVHNHFRKFKITSKKCIQDLKCPQELLPCRVRNVRLLDGCAKCYLCLLWKESEVVGPDSEVPSHLQKHKEQACLANP